MTATNNLVFNLLPTQGLLPTINANTTYTLMQRGGGKTTSIAQRVQHLDRVMPGSQILLFSDTYGRLMERIVPNLIAFWDLKLKWIEGVDYVKYKKPPEYFLKPYIKLDKYDHVITLKSGTSICLVSLKIEGSANAYNAQAAIGDEVKFCKEEEINTEIVPAIRGMQEIFGHLAEYLSVWMFTDKFGPHTKWLLAKRKLQNKQAIEMVYAMQHHVWELEKTLEQAVHAPKLAALRAEIEAYEEKLIRIRKQMVFVCEMQPYENRDILGEDYFKRAKRICSPHEFDVAILNKDPDKVEQTFYSMFSSMHKYSNTLDYDPMLPLYISMDYNFRIVPITVVQVSQLPDQVYKTINFIDEVFVLHPQGIIHAIQLFCERFSMHINKEVNYIYDHTAIGRNPLLQTYKDTVVKAFNQQGWRVIEHFTHGAPDHDIKHNRLNEYLLNLGEHAVKINMDKCEYLIKSIEQSPAKLVMGKTQKDKSSEKDDKFPAEESTHFSDAFDMMLWGLFEHNVMASGIPYSMPLTMG